MTTCAWRMPLAERVTSALLLGREQQALAERARLLANLSDFARATDAVLETDRLAPALMDALTGIFPGDVMTLTTLDRATGRYHLRAVRGVERRRSLGWRCGRVTDRPGGRSSPRIRRARSKLHP